MLPSFHLEGIWAHAWARDRYHLSPSDTHNAHLQKCGQHLREPRPYLFIYFFFIFSCLFLLPEAPLDGTVQLFVKCCSEQWCRASVFVTRLPGSTAVFWGAFECLISLLCYPSFLLIFVFHSQLCSEKMALWPVSRSINDKALCRRNLQLDQLCLSVVCLHKFWPWWIKFFFSWFSPMWHSTSK